jgi:uncharacterized membrane protein
MKVRFNNKLGLIMWVLYLVFIVLMIWLFAGCATTHPADKRFSKERVNSMKVTKLKIKNCERTN